LKCQEPRNIAPTFEEEGSSLVVDHKEVEGQETHSIKKLKRTGMLNNIPSKDPLAIVVTSLSRGYNEASLIVEIFSYPILGVFLKGPAINVCTSSSFEFSPSFAEVKKVRIAVIRGGGAPLGTYLIPFILFFPTLSHFLEVLCLLM